MAVFRVEKNRGYTVMSNFHLKDTSLKLKAKGLLSMMLSLPDEWNYTTRGLAAICKEGVDSIGSTLRELEKQGYIIRNQLRDSKGRISDTEYIIYEHPQHNPDATEPDTDIPHTEKPYLENTAQLNTNRLTTNQEKKDLLITEVSNPNQSHPASCSDIETEMGLEWMGCENITELKELVLENLEYEFIKRNHDKERLDEIVDIIVETLCSTKPTINISGDEYPARLVKEKLLRLDSSHIDYVFECLQKTTMGFYKIANYLNLQGIQKIKRANGTLSQWSTHFVRMIIDNPVYSGKIAFGRRTREKVKGTKNEYRQVHQDEYIIADGQHEAIIDEELWSKAHEKREITGIKSPSKIGRDRAHLLSGILKCPKCGAPMYTNKHAWTNKDGTYKEIYYYVCSKARTARGKSCDYKAMLKKTDIEPLVIEAIRELIKNEDFATEIKSKIGKQIDTSTLDRELKNYEGKLREVDLNKTRLENEIDSLPEDTRFRERKLHDMTLRLDGLYDIIVELEEKIEDVKLRRKAVEQDAITLCKWYNKNAEKFQS